MSEALARLIVRDAAGSERQVEISRTPFTLGRQSDNDLVLLDIRVSRHHARIVREGQAYFLEDAGSRYGTFVNSERIDSRGLTSGDQIRLGVADAYQIFFVADQPEIPRLLAKFEKVSESRAPQLQHLGLLLQMAQMLHRAPALKEVLTALVDAGLQLSGAERGLLFLRGDAGELRLHLARAQGGTYLPPALGDYSRAVVDRVAESGQEEVLLEEVFTGRAPGETGIVGGGVRGIVAVPLQKLPVTEAGGETIQQARPDLLGVLYLDSRDRPGALTGLDRQVLQTLAAEGATIIENARLFRIAREQERLRHELAFARKIQQSLLPRGLPHSEYYALGALTISSQTVGGDYYDVVQLPHGRWGVVVADVSGKGLPAAMMAGNLQGAFAAVAAGDPALGDLFARVNDFLCERTPREMFATAFYGVLDLHGEFSYVNAGQVLPLVVRNRGEVERLESSNFPLGFFPGVKFDADRVQLHLGDQVVLYSDGVTEAQNASGEFFGEARLRAFLEACAAPPAEVVCENVIAAVQDFVGAAPQADDLTVVVLRYGAPKGQLDRSDPT